MGFVDALATRPADDNEAELKKLARDMVVSFSRMRYAEKLSPAQMKAHHIDREMGEGVSQAIARIEQTAGQYQKGTIDAGTATRNFEMAIPAMMRFLIHEAMDGGDGCVRTLTEIDHALHCYFNKPSIENATHLVGLCLQDKTVNAHWLFDNLARAVLFCEDLSHRGQGRTNQ